MTTDDHKNEAEANEPIEVSEATASETQTGITDESRPVRWRELLAILLAVILVDLTVYRGAGFAGLAMLIFVLPLLFLLGTPKYSLPRIAFLFLTLIGITVLKLLWCGFPVTFVAGMFLLFAFGLLLSGRKFRLTGTIVFAFQAIISGCLGMGEYEKSMRKWRWLPTKSVVLGVILPLFALAIFVPIFIFANPDLTKSVHEWLLNCGEYFREHLLNWFPSGPELAIWAATLWLMIGWLRPDTEHLMWEANEYINHLFYDNTVSTELWTESERAKNLNRFGYVRTQLKKLQTDRATDHVKNNTKDGTAPDAETLKEQAHERANEMLNELVNAELTETPKSPVEYFAEYYLAFRNTLLTVIVLFAAYLTFEFVTLWCRVFPEGFYYAGYAHKGAAWLAVALAISTLILSVIFRESVYKDKRISFLKSLAWVWSAENIILAIAVYHRLQIYVNFNGMTRMRVIAVLGMTAVLLGFVFVIIKVAKKCDIEWLLNRYIAIVLLMLFLDCVLPVDWFVHHYNTRRALKADYAPVVQMSVHPNSSEGYLAMIPLIQCEDEIIRDGIRSKLAYELLQLERNQAGNHLEEHKYHWTQYQIADVILHRRLNDQRKWLAPYLNDAALRDSTISKFDKYVYQWY